MGKLPDENALILVAVVPHPRDLDIARTLGWYRIPLRSSPKLVAVDYLAFYQPAAFGRHRWRVEFIAPVLGHELATRRALLGSERNHPRAEEEYFKIQLGPFQRLPFPILARGWKRLTFLYTTGAYLRGAQVLQDLVVAPEERKLLWRALRERASESQGYMAETWPESIDLDPGQLAQVLGMIHLPAGDKE